MCADIGHCDMVVRKVNLNPSKELCVPTLGTAFAAGFMLRRFMR
jgi:hypothetical protein